MRDQLLDESSRTTFTNGATHRQAPLARALPKILSRG
jgi:hypothetical protein